MIQNDQANLESIGISSKSKGTLLYSQHGLCNPITLMHVKQLTAIAY
jgi:hypothetical protein